MAQIIQIKRRIPGTGAPATLAAGEPAAAVTAAGAAELYVGDGSAVRTLVSDQRQVEKTGDQANISGNKSFATNGAITIAPGGATGGLHVTGGNDGDVLSTDGTGNLSWLTPPAPVSVGGT